MPTGDFTADGLYFQTIILQPNMFNGAGRGAHSKFDVRPFEGGTRCAGDAGQPAFMVEANFGVGANVNCQCHAISFQQCGWQATLRHGPLRHNRQY